MIQPPKLRRIRGVPRCDEDGTLGEKILVAIVEGVTPVLATIVIGKFFPQLLEPKKDEDEDC